MMRKMGFLKLRKATLEKAVSLVLLLSFVMGFLSVPLNEIFAAQVGIDTTVSTAQLEHIAMGSNVVFTTDQTGYKFYVDSTGNCAYSKTTNGGTSWGAAVSIDAQTDCFGVSVWYDRWTPGDNGNYIHILTEDPSTGNNDLWYNRLDVTNDTRLLGTAPVSVVTNSGQGGAFVVGSNAASITKGTDGTLYMGISDNTDGYVVECSSSCDTASSWTETGTNPMDAADDFTQLLPLASGNILLINRDISADDMRSKVWNNGSGSWDAGWTTIDANALENATYDPEFNAAVNVRTGDVYLAYVDNATTGTIGGNNDSIKTAVYSGGAWTAKTNVVTNVTANPAGLTDVTIGINAYDGTVYVGYTGRTTAATATTGRVYWKSSTDGMTSWGAQTGPIDTVGADQKYGLSINMTGDERMYITWYGITPDDMWGDTLANLAPATVVAAVGAQKTQIRASTTAQYVGGGFSIVDTAATRNVTGITISEVGTVDGTTDIDNIKLQYDLDTTAPYDCASESYSGSETQFGSTDTDGFSAADGSSTFTGSVSITTTQAMCVYTVMDVQASANTKTIDIQITNPLSQVVVSGTVLATPMAAVAISGATTIVDSNITQTGYHWRNDDNSEASATAFFAASENTSVNVQQETPIRLRIGVSNSTGATSSLAANFRLEFAQNPSTCSAATGWTDVNAVTDEWDMYNSTFLTNGSDTTNISVTSGGVTDVGTTFLTPNGGQLDTSSQSGNLTLSPSNFTDLEYAIVPASSIPNNTGYCFRVTNAGTALPVYTNYAQATVKTVNDFKIQRGVSTITAGNTGVTITAGVDYDAPISTSTAFIRITNTGLTGAGRSTGSGNSNAADVMAYISNPDNLKTSITFSRAATNNDSRISWEIIEYRGVAGGENEIKVRKTEVMTYTNGSATVNGTVLSNVVDDTDVVAFITGQGNPNANRTSYVSGLSTSNWDGTNNRIVLTRAQTSGAVPTSVAAVEFTGANWKIQRSEHTYSAAGSTETNSITAVNSLSRTFLHVQKRASVNTHANFSHEVWLSGIGQISFLLDAAATTPGGQVSVAWVIENTQTTGTTMDVTRSNSSFNTTGVSPQTNVVSITKTLSDLSIASIFVNNRSDTNTATWPEPIMGVRLLNTTQYELWRSDIGANINYRTEVVEWPTAIRKIEQSYYRLYVDNNALKPTDPWPTGVTDLGENAEMTANFSPMQLTDKVRIRMSLKISSASEPAGLDSFKLQYGKRLTTCSAITGWNDVGVSSSTTAPWRAVNNTPADGTVLSTDPPTGGDLVLSVSTVAGAYEEDGPSLSNPYIAFANDEVEYDWVVQDNAAISKSSYCFRMVQSAGTLLDTYTNYPVLRTVGYEPKLSNWRWYDDATTTTPVVPLAGENVAPTGISNTNSIKLRVTLGEVSGAQGTNVKFKLQYSEQANFSTANDVVATTTCLANSLWCYYNGAGVDNAVISSKVLTASDACSGGVGNGCGTYNESTSTTTATYDQLAFSKAEYEFTIKNAGARANAVYYFRLWNINDNEAVAASTTYASLVASTSRMIVTSSGVNSGTSVDGHTSDVTTTNTSIPFGVVPFNTPYVAIQRLSFDTNATQGYQVRAFADQQLTNAYGDTFLPVSGTNAAPTSWATGCPTSQNSCFGYHPDDDVLLGGSSRFAANDTFAAFTMTPTEVFYTGVPGSYSHDIVYKIRANNLQPAGDYRAALTYIISPIY